MFPLNSPSLYDVNCVDKLRLANLRIVYFCILFLSVIKKLSKGEKVMSDDLAGVNSLLKPSGVALVFIRQWVPTMHHFIPKPKTCSFVLFTVDGLNHCGIMFLIWLWLKSAKIVFHVLTKSVTPSVIRLENFYKYDSRHDSFRSFWFKSVMIGVVTGHLWEVQPHCYASASALLILNRWLNIGNNANEEVTKDPHTTLRSDDIISLWTNGI